MNTYRAEQYKVSMSESFIYSNKSVQNQIRKKSKYYIKINQCIYYQYQDTENLVISVYNINSAFSVEIVLLTKEQTCNNNKLQGKQ